MFATNDLQDSFEGVHDPMPGTSRIQILALGCGLSALFSIPLIAQSIGTAANTAAPAGSSSPKIGIVRIQEAIGATSEGQKELNALQQRFTPKQTELKNLNDEVENLRKQLQAQGDKLNDEERGNRQRTIDSKAKTLQRNIDDAQSEFQQAEQEVVSRLGQKMLTILDKYAKEKGYTVVFDVSNPQTPVLWASQTTDITKDLVEAYNAQNPASAGAPAKTPPASGASKPPATSAPPPPKKP
jgi:outer membrane protein